MSLIRTSARSITCRRLAAGGIRMTVLAFLFGLLFLVQPTLLSHENQSEGPGVYHTRMASGPDLACYHQSSHLPFPPAEVLTELQTAEESNEDSNDKPTRLHPELSVNLFLNFHSDKLLFDHLRCSEENRPSISLFILHHSWKSFPA